MRQNPTHKSMRQIGILIIKEIYLIVITSNQFELNFVWLILIIGYILFLILNTIRDYLS